ncbi:MAG: hypothetical protein GY780_02985 [bacterium]|nr:hypothetical protein [bacterium]
MFRFSKLSPQVALVVLTGFIFLLPACETSDDPVNPEPSGPASVSGTVGAAGGTLVSSDGRLTAIIPPGALATTTDITISEVDPPGNDSRLGEFVPVGKLQMEPAGLQLLQEVEITLETGIIHRAKSSELTKNVQQTKDFELLLALLVGDELSRIPDQEISIDFLGGVYQIKFFVEAFQDMMWGPPLAIDRPEIGDYLSMIEVNYSVVGLNLALNEPFEVEVEVETAPADYWEILEFDIMQPPPPYVWDENPLEPEVQVVSPTIVDYLITPGFFAEEIDESTLDLTLVMDLVLNMPNLDFPENTENTTEPISFRVKYSHPAFNVDSCFSSCLWDDATINTGMTGLRGMSVNHGSIAEIDPDGEIYPWLYVTGNTGVQYYRLITRPDGEIVNAIKRGEVLSLDAEGTVPVSILEGGARVRAMFTYGLGGAYRTHWNNDPAVNDYGALLSMAGSVEDAISYGGLDQANGFCFVSNGVVRFQEFDPQYGIYTEALDSSLFTGVAFVDVSGPLTTAFVDPLHRTVLVGTGGAPGQIWFHDRESIYAEGSVVTTVGNDVRQIRGLDGIIGVTNFGSNSISILSWSGGAGVTNHGQTTVCSGPTSLDIVKLLNGNLAMICTSGLGNTYTILEVDSIGEVVSNTTFYLPLSCPGSKNAVWIPGRKLNIAFTCEGSGLVFIEETDLVSN